MPWRTCTPGEPWTCMTLSFRGRPAPVDELKSACHYHAVEVLRLWRTADLRNVIMLWRTCACGGSRIYHAVDIPHQWRTVGLHDVIILWGTCACGGCMPA
ncbi:hypothetical protein NDU88_006226 [Pleurodeles waltl]|uniref:Uncharacterized protein n=1 Tax=Pleurodeles waltl TaxID=8319 RepID=A0AAV7WFN2_PLEWA|nr:hypothetical protein NDU88_006226 [Pleurodeles waltl]